MPYPEMLVAPMRQQLVEIGFKSLLTADEVSAVMKNNEGSLKSLKSKLGSQALIWVFLLLRLISAFDHSEPIDIPRTYLEQSTQPLGVYTI